MVLGSPIVEVDAERRSVVTGMGDRFGYGRLIWAAGGSARRIGCSGHDLRGVHSVRTRSDVDRLIAELPDVRRVVVIGGGYIGLEAAAVLRKSGRHVVLVEALDRVLARVTGEELSRFFEAQHRANGVDLRLGSSVDRLEGTDRVEGVRLTDGTLLPADMVIVGIGLVPAVEPLLAAGAKGGNGVAVDHHCRTSLPDVYAIGDCAMHPNRYAETGEVRLESVQNANDQAVTAAKSLLGTDVVYDAVPWFWSHQYDLRLQTVGLSRGHDAFVIRGELSQRSFSIVYLRRGRVIALDCVNATRDYVQGRRLVVEAAELAPAILADSDVQLKEMI